jgi:hypothetical protein
MRVTVGTMPMEIEMTTMIGDEPKVAMIRM